MEFSNIVKLIPVATRTMFEFRANAKIPSLSIPDSPLSNPVFTQTTLQFHSFTPKILIRRHHPAT
jgi:hypothetical protein